MWSRTFSSAFTSASTERPSSCSWIFSRAWADCIRASMVSRSAFSFLISPWTCRSELLADSASFEAVSMSARISVMSASSWFFFWIRMTARSSWAVSTAAFSSASVWASSRVAFFKRSSMSSRRRMMDAVAVLSLVYFSTIELMAFS